MRTGADLFKGSSFTKGFCHHFGCDNEKAPLGKAGGREHGLSWGRQKAAAFSELMWVSFQIHINFCSCFERTCSLSVGVRKLPNQGDRSPGTQHELARGPGLQKGTSALPGDASWGWQVET